LITETEIPFVTNIINDMQSQQERRLSEEGKATRCTHTCDEKRDEGIFDLRLQALLSHSASNIQRGHHTTPQHYAYGHSSPSFDLCLTNAMALSTSNMMLSGIVNNCIATSLDSSATLSSAAVARRQQALADPGGNMHHSSDYRMQMFPTQVRGMAQTMRTSVGLVDQPASPECKSAQSQKNVPVQQMSTSYLAVDATAQSSAVKSKDDTVAIASSISAKQLSKQRGRPKRALTAYNIFFKEAREQILADQQKYHQPYISNKEGKRGKGVRNCVAENPHGVSFVDMGKMIAKRWKELDNEARLMYKERAKAEKRRYRDKLAEYKMNEREKVEAKFAALQASLSEETKQQYFTGRK